MVLSWFKVTAGKAVYGNAFLIGVEHVGALNMEVGAGMLLETCLK